MCVFSVRDLYAAILRVLRKATPRIGLMALALPDKHVNCFATPPRLSASATDSPVLHDLCSCPRQPSIGLAGVRVCLLLSHVDPHFCCPVRCWMLTDGLSPTRRLAPWTWGSQTFGHFAFPGKFLLVLHVPGQVLIVPKAPSQGYTLAVVVVINWHLPRFLFGMQRKDGLPSTADIFHGLGPTYPDVPQPP